MTKHIKSLKKKVLPFHRSRSFVPKAHGNHHT